MDGPSRHPDLCVWYVRIWPHAAEDKSRTAFLAPDASMVVATHHTVGGRLVLFRGLRIPEEPLGGYIPLSLTGGHIPRAFATILSNRCVLFARWLPCPVWPNTLQRPTARSSSSTSVYPGVFPVWDTLAIRALSGGVSGGCLKEAAWQRSLLALASGRSFALHGHVSFFFGGVKGQMHRHSGAWFSHRALEGNAHRSRHCCRGLLLSYAFATDHTPPFAILGALWLNTAPRPLCVRVSVHVYTAHAGDRPQKSGGARGCQWQRTLEARRWPFQAGNPREALCAEVVRSDFLDGPSRHPDLCVWFVRLWPHAAEDKSRTASFAPDVSYGAFHADGYAPHRWRSVAGAFPGGLEYPKSLHPMGLVSHRRSYLVIRCSFSHTALCAGTLCPLGCHLRGL